MKVNAATRRALKWRREKRDMVAKGYRQSDEIVWQINRGGWQDKKIADVSVAADGNSIWYRLVDREDGE